MAVAVAAAVATAMVDLQLVLAFGARQHMRRHTADGRVGR